MYVLIPNIMADYNNIIIVINEFHSVLCCGFLKLQFILEISVKCNFCCYKIKSNYVIAYDIIS